MRSGYCKHFDGAALVRRGSCLVGVRYSDVEAERLPLRAGLPCVTEAVGTCPLRAYPTPEEIAAFNREVDAAVSRLVENDKAGRCNVCGATIERRRTVMRCAYAEPCGHRIGQVGR